MIKARKGKYKSETLGTCEAFLVGVNTQAICIVDLGGTLYTCSADHFLFEDGADEISKVFPRVADFFNQELLEINIKFKG